MTTNLRALIHMSGLRLCTMAQWEIRRLFQLIRHEIFQVSPFLGSFLAPKCVPSATATRWATGTSTARSGRTRTPSWAPGRTRRRRPRPPAGSSRSARSPVGIPDPARALAAGERAHETADDPGEAGPGLGAGRQDLLVGERLAGVAGSGVRDQRDAAHLDPAHRAAIASSTVDMPTASPPSVRSIRTSAGVSYDGPEQADVDALAYLDALGRERLAQARAEARASRRR